MYTFVFSFSTLGRVGGGGGGAVAVGGEVGVKGWMGVL
jgi:hypothetical protein